MPLPAELKTARAGRTMTRRLKNRTRGSGTRNQKSDSNAAGIRTPESDSKSRRHEGSKVSKILLLVLLGLVTLIMFVNSNFADKVHPQEHSNSVAPQLNKLGAGERTNSDKIKIDTNNDKTKGDENGSKKDRKQNDEAAEAKSKSKNEEAKKSPANENAIVNTNEAHAIDTNNDKSKDKDDDDDDDGGGVNEKEIVAGEHHDDDDAGAFGKLKAEGIVDKNDNGNIVDNDTKRTGNDNIVGVDVKDQANKVHEEDDDDDDDGVKEKEIVAGEHHDDDDAGAFGKLQKDLAAEAKSKHEEAEKSRANENSSENTNEANAAHKIANLSCEAYGGPSNKDAEEMVYWEDIPRDALHMSPFHVDHPEYKPHQTGANTNKVQKITQFLTFEPDEGGWNNIRMAMETVLAMSFAMGRTLVLPPHQGMYLIDHNKGGLQKNKFSFDHFFHMESISTEHVGLDIITTTQFLEKCARGEIVDANNKPLTPPGGKTDWDGMPYSEQKELRAWLRTASGQNLLHFDPEKCIVAFPASSSQEDADELELLPDKIADSEGGFPSYERYIGKPNAIDAPAIERLKEMSADRKALCLYTPELQQTQWIHFPVGMTTNYGEQSRLLVHFYAFLFFQDWKQDLWMKRFVRDHVRYIDEIQCAAARVVTKLRQRISTRTASTSASTRFDTIHIRRGDFQFKETRVDGDEILTQLKRVLDPNTTLYIATDERDKSFFEPIVKHFADVAFLDDFIESELKEVNTNYFGMIDQLVASRGEVFLGCWFSTFTGYINRLRGYHADDHEMPGFEQGIINSYYYAMPDRFDHLREYWPIKKQFYAREFPASWRLIDTSIGTMDEKEK